MGLVRAWGRTIVAGVVLGCVTVAGLTLLAVVGLHPYQPESHRLAVARQPELRTAVLQAQDLPPSNAPSPSPAPTHRTEARDVRCQAFTRLLGDAYTVRMTVISKTSRETGFPAIGRLGARDQRR